MVGMERKKENSSAAGRDMPATCPAAMVAIERDVPGKTAERICTAPIQIACEIDMLSISVVVGWVNNASTAHITAPPISSAPPITLKLSRFSPMILLRRYAGMAVTMKAIIVRDNG